MLDPPKFDEPDTRAPPCRFFDCGTSILLVIHGRDARATSHAAAWIDNRHFGSSAELL
jgi:hypothetical protein